MGGTIPFGEDVMTLIMGLDGPMEPGQHGRVKAPMPSMDTVKFITEIRDMCDEFLKKCEKCDEESKGMEDNKDEGSGGGMPVKPDEEKKDEEE